MSQAMEAVEVTLTERIDLERRRKGWSWAELAAQMGVSASTVDTWRNAGWERIRLDKARVLARVLDIDARTLIPEDES